MYKSKWQKAKKRHKEDEALLKGMNCLMVRAPVGRKDHVNMIVVVKRTGVKKRMSTKEPKERKEKEQYLGYIKPGKNGKQRKFWVWSNNPDEDKWRDRIAGRSDDISIAKVRE
jgi:hypothetical protein